MISRLPPIQAIADNPATAGLVLDFDGVVAYHR